MYKTAGSLITSGCCTKYSSGIITIGKISTDIEGLVVSGW